MSSIEFGDLGVMGPPALKDMMKMIAIRRNMRMEEGDPSPASGSSGSGGGSGSGASGSSSGGGKSRRSLGMNWF
jgi:hypothetical protein